MTLGGKIKLTTKSHQITQAVFDGFYFLKMHPFKQDEWLPLEQATGDQQWEYPHKPDRRLCILRVHWLN